MWSYSFIPPNKKTIQGQFAWVMLFFFLILTLTLFGETASGLSRVYLKGTQSGIYLTLWRSLIEFSLITQMIAILNTVKMTTILSIETEWIIGRLFR